MTRPRILLDVDGVLTHSFAEQVCEILCANGYKARYEDIDQWDILASFNVPQHARSTIYDKMKREGVAASFAPAPGSQAFVKELQHWASVYVVTSAMGGPHWAHEREEWLHRHYNISKYKVVSTASKHVVGGAAFVDDKLAHLRTWAEEHPEGKAILFRIPPNRHDKWPLEASTYDELQHHLSALRAH